MSMILVVRWKIKEKLHLVTDIFRMYWRGQVFPSTKLQTNIYWKSCEKRVTLNSKF